MDRRCAAVEYALFTIALILLPATAFSQQPSSPAPPIDRTNAERVRQQEMSSREWQLRNFGKEPSNPADQRQVKALMAQTEEDFNRILTRHNEIARAISSDKPVDYHFVSEAVEEIRKHASRLQSTLALQLPANEDKVTEKEALNETQMKDGLIKLCKEIRSFVTNPIIQTPNTIDAQQLSKARRDLEGVIQLSAQIKKDANKLSKNR